MPWQAYYDVATGRLRSQGQAVTDNLPVGMARKEFAGTPAPGAEWDPVALQWGPPPPIRVTLAPVEFKMRMRREERKGIRQAARSDGDVEDLSDLLDSARALTYDHPMVVSGLAMLVAKGLLTPERAAEIGDF